MEYSGEEQRTESEASVVCDATGPGYHRNAHLSHDIVGYWTELKLEIIQKYASAYSRILSSQKNPSFYHVYIDAFAGSGIHYSKQTGRSIPGSPVVALETIPPFKEYHLIDLNCGKIERLKELAAGRTNVNIYNADCNKCLLNEVFPKVKFEQYRRGLCLLDPYKINLNWEVMRTAGQMKSIDMFLNFMVMDINMNVLHHNPEGVHQSQIQRMNAYWGDESWRDAMYDTTSDFFGLPEKQPNEALVAAFRQRLMKVAGFAHVPPPIPMRNSNNAVIYYLFFASQKFVAGEIVTEIFERYRNRQGA